MGDLRPGWRRHRFREMVSSAGATRKARGWDAREAGVDRYVGLEHLNSNCLKIRRWGSPEDVGANSDLRHFEPGDVILARRGIELRKVGVAEFRGVASGHGLVFRAKPEVVLAEFLPFFMQSDVFMKRADQFSVGSLSRTVNLSTLLREEFALPPLDEQRRIAGVLKASEAHTQHLIDLEEYLEATYQSAIDHLVEQLIPEARTYFRLGRSPAEGVTPLDAASRITDCKHRTPKLVKKGVPMVAPGDIRWGPLQLQSCKRIEEVEYPGFMDHVTVKEGDLVLSRNQTFGKAAYVTKETKFALGQDTVLVQPTSFPSSYLYLMLRSTFVQRQILRYAAGSTFGRINLGDIRRLMIPKADTKTLATAHDVLTQFEGSVDTMGARASAAKQQRATLLNRIVHEEGLSE